MEQLFRKYTNAYNTKYNTNIHYNGNIECHKFDDEPLHYIRISLTVYEQKNIIYDCIKEFIINKEKTKSVKMHDYEFIDIADDLDTLVELTKLVY